MSQTSPTSKRSRLDSPQQQQQQNALVLPSHSWKPAHTSNSTTTNQFNTGNKLGLAGLSNPNDVGSSAAEDNRPSASGSGTYPTGSTNNNVQTDFDAMNDAVGIAGVDIAAEEELARTQATLYRTSNRNYSSYSQLPQQQPWMKTPRVKLLDFLDKPALTLMVQHIAASFQLKTLEPAILDVLTQAAEARMHSLIVDSIAAKDHRVASSHLRPPPLYPSSMPKGKQKEREAEAMYDQVVYDEPERILSMLARVEGEEERKARLERESTEGEGADAGPGGSQLQQSGLLGTGVEGGSPHEKAAPVKKEKKRKREGPGQLARNMSEDARARQSNQTAMRSVGGRSKYSWLSGGVVSGGSNKALPTSLMASLPAPKFAPQTSSGAQTQQGPSTPTASDHHSAHPTSSTNRASAPFGPSSSSTPSSSSLAAATSTSRPKKESSHFHHLSSRLGGPIPAKHPSSLSPHIGLKDCLFALERERGTGAGKGTGSKSLFKAYLNPNPPATNSHSNPSASSADLPYPPPPPSSNTSSTQFYHHLLRK
ncbi:uncharacterized protein VP01_208g6 [Puccinia sorghi]|uniref:Transcription initiation factor TFIID subunit 4 n=1 Tax=Puccinia sorghi TaxID=27349 RepID=A0A0L6VAI1_9BASI|nr:uncharacterized protein VP01_208g6 [Puccinia sorghi]